MARSTMSADRELSTDTVDDNKLVKPKVEFRSLLQHAGATQDIFTIKEVMFFLGQYIIQKQLYDQNQQHMVHCSQDALGHVLGVDSFSVKEPRVLFSMITKNLVPVRNPDCPSTCSETPGISQIDWGAEESDSESRCSSPERRSRRRRRRRRSLHSSEPGPSHSAGDEDEEDEREDRKRRRSGSCSITFDSSGSWCVIGGLRGGRDRGSSQSSDSHSTSVRSEVAVAISDSDNDNFSVEFEVESLDSDDYDEDEGSLSGDDQVYEVTIFQANDDDDGDDSFDDDTEITEADYWKCGECGELNAPLPRNCLRCWTLRQDWLPDEGSAPESKLLPLKAHRPASAADAAGADAEEGEGLDVPDGKRAKSPAASSPCRWDSASCPADPSSGPAPNSQHEAADSRAPLSSSLLTSSQLSSSQPSSSPTPPELERSSSAEWRLPESCLDPCLICQSRPKNGCIVHGHTGHLMACYVCARKLKRRNKLCPVCRLPIQSVVLTYVS